MSGIGLDRVYVTPELKAAQDFNAAAKANSAPTQGIGLRTSGSVTPPAPVPMASPTAPTASVEMPTLDTSAYEPPKIPDAAPEAPAAAPPEKPLIDFNKSPMAAIGLVLSNFAAGMNGTELPSDKMRAQQIEAQAQQYKTAALGMQLLDMGIPHIMKADPAQRPAIIADMDKRFSPALGGLPIGPLLTALTSGSDEKIAATMGALKELQLSPATMAYFAKNPPAAEKFMEEYTANKAKTLSASTDKKTIVPAGATVLDDSGKVLFTAPEKPVEHNVAPGGVVIDGTGKVIYRAPSAPDSIAAPTQIGYTGPDGEEVQTAASFDKHSGHYVDAATGKPILNPQNLRVLGNASGGARSQNVVNRVLTSTEDATSGIENLARAGVGQSGGIFSNLTTTPLAALGRSVTPQDVQDYNATNAGLARAMGALATGGMAVDKTTQESFQGLNLNTGDSYITKMRKLAELRQQSQNAITVQLKSSILNSEQKTELKALNARIAKAIPWTVSDVQDLENSGNPKMSLRDAAKAKGLGAKPSAPSIPTVASPADAAKLPRGTIFKTPDGRTLQVP